MIGGQINEYSYDELEPIEIVRYLEILMDVLLI